MNQTVQKSTRVQNLSSFVWSIAEILRGDFKQSEYGKVILPFIVMRRLDCILEASKPTVLAAEKNLPEQMAKARFFLFLNFAPSS